MKAKKQPSYITKNWQYRTWTVFGMTATTLCAVAAIQEPAALLGVAGFSFMTARLILMRNRWKKQERDSFIPNAAEERIKELGRRVTALEAKPHHRV